jgi:hypothetical protein
MVNFDIEVYHESNIKFGFIEATKLPTCTYVLNIESCYLFGFPTKTIVVLVLQHCYQFFTIPLFSHYPAMASESARPPDPQENDRSTSQVHEPSVIAQNDAHNSAGPGTAHEYYLSTNNSKKYLFLLVSKMMMVINCSISTLLHSTI